MYLQVVVQKSNGELLWEGGDNRKLLVPEDAPAGLSSVSEDVLDQKVQHNHQHDSHGSSGSL